MIRFQQHQLKQLSQLHLRRFSTQMHEETRDLAKSALQQLSSDTPETDVQTSSRTGDIGEERDAISSLIFDAQRLGLSSESAIRLYIHYMLRVALTENTAPQHEVLLRTLADPTCEEEEKAELLDAELMLASIASTT